ncbi:helix-turn-helix transcriptional regulator [Candidatus Babeliales bacterium]|nr:helix-turn-helix transcriptional regulator [Candidatus Babeliales bacterium]
MVSTRLRVKELLRQRRWTTKVLAEKTGLSESYLTHIKNGTRRWNEDGLKKLALAFELEPIDIFENGGRISGIEGSARSLSSDGTAVSTRVKVVPVVGEIPSSPSSHNNKLVQLTTGFKGENVPVVGSEDDAMFALLLKDELLEPRFSKGDHLIVSPEVWTRSGDIVAVEYGKDEQKKIIAQVNYTNDFVVLESVGQKSAPIALVRGKDTFRIIGKVICRYQKMG